MTTIKTPKKLIEVALPLDAINVAAAREKSIRHGHPSTLHLWWARRPLAAARAVIFAQMVNDPGYERHLGRGVNKEKAAIERERLFGIIERLVLWENTNNEKVLDEAREEIWKSWRETCSLNKNHPQAAELFNPDKLPAFHDPFAGGGALPLEAQRLGLESYASDLNPVAVTINKAMIEIPPKFANRPPVHPEARKEFGVESKEWGEVRSEYALSGNDCLAEGDGGSAGGVSFGSETTEGGNLRDAIATDEGNRIGSGEHCGGMDQGIATGESALSSHSPRLAGGSGDAVDPLRADRVVSARGDGSIEEVVRRGKPDSDDIAKENAKGREISEEGRGMSNEEREVSEAVTHSSLLSTRSSKTHSSLLSTRSSKPSLLSTRSSKPSLLSTRSYQLFPREWKGAEGLAEDVRRYGAWMRAEAEKRIGHLYPKIEITEEMAIERADLKPLIGQKLTVIAWLWARTVKSPNPAYSHIEVPLASTFVLSSKEGKEVYVEPVIEGDSYRFTVKVGIPTEDAENGTKANGRGANFICLLSGSPISGDYIKAEGQFGRLGEQLMAIVTEGQRGRVYLAPTEEHLVLARQAKPTWKPRGDVPSRLTGGTCVPYGLKEWGDLYTPRQLVALTTFCDLVQEAIEKVHVDAFALGMTDDNLGLDSGGTSATAYAQAVGIYLAFCVDKNTLTNTTLATWQKNPDRLTQAYARQAIAMTWDFAEANPLSDAGGGFGITTDAIAKVLLRLNPSDSGYAYQQDAASNRRAGCVISTDPPYYNNIGYADLSDYFYVWLRKNLKPIFPEIYATLVVPKSEELVATPHRHGNKEKAEAFFLSGMTRAIQNLAKLAHPAFPVTIYYAFKQSETTEDSGTSNTGWDTFLEAVIRSGFSITGTWPMRTELIGNLKKIVNALASSIVLVCRKRAADAPTISRREFLRELNAVLPDALLDMTPGGVNSPVAPVDLSQAIIGPGMAIFSQYAAVLEADGKAMSVRTALQLINRFLSEDDFDHDTQFCLHWFEGEGWAEGKYGDADVLARAKGTSVGGLQSAGVVESGGGKLRLLRWAELPADWSPEKDNRIPIWESLHQLILALNQQGETAAGALLARMPTRAESMRALAYRLYTLCERKGWADDARSYNELITAWGNIEAASHEIGHVGSQPDLFL